MIETHSAANHQQANRPAEKERGVWTGTNAVVIIFIVAIGLRFNGITFDSMWLDEGYQTMVNAIGVKPMELEVLRPEPFVYSLGEPRSIAELLANFRQVDPLCPPLYFLILNRWMVAFGTSDLAIRSLSAITSIIALAVLYFGTRKIFGPKVALLALLMQAVSPFDITYAQEARMYALVTLTSTVSCLSFFFLMQACQSSSTSERELRTSSTEASQRRTSAGGTQVFRRLFLLLLYSLSTWALINTHYTGLYIVAFQGLFGTAYSIKQKSISMFVHLSLGWALTCLFWLPWFDLFRQSTEKRANFYVSRDAGLLWSAKGSFKIFLNWVSLLSGGRIAAYAAPLYATSVVLIGACALSSMSQRVRDAAKRLLPSKSVSTKNEATTEKILPGAMIFVWCWALMPALIAFSADMAECRKTVEVTRYLIGTAPAVFILAACGARFLLEQGGRLRWFVAAHVCFALVNYTYAHLVEQREPWRQMATVIEKQVPAKEVLLVSPHYNMICLNRYLSTPRMQVGTGPLLGNEQVYGVLKNQPAFWLLTAQQGASVTAFIPPEYQQTQSIKMKHGLELTQWQSKGVEPLESQ